MLSPAGYSRPRRVGLVGFGSIAEHGHLPAWQSFPQVQVAAVADLSPERLSRARELLPNATLYASPLDLITQADIDTVDICTPPNTHADLMVAACRQGIEDIVSEKPFVLSVDDYKRVDRARSEYGARIISVNNWMHSCLFAHVREVVSSGVLGKVEHIELRTQRPDAANGNAGWMPRWRVDPAFAGGGIVLDHGWHQLYLLMGWINEPVVGVRASTRTVDLRHAPVEDEATIDLVFPTGTGRIELSWTAAGRENAGMVRGTRGSIAIHDDRIEVHAPGHNEVRYFAGKLTESSYHPDWFEHMIHLGILDADRREADRNFTEAGAIVGIVGAIYRSAQDGGVLCSPKVGRSTSPASHAARETDSRYVLGSRGGNSA